MRAHKLAGWESLSEAGDLSLIDGGDLLKLAEKSGLQCLGKGAVGSEDEIAKTLSRVTWESACIARDFRRPPAKQEKDSWKSLAKRATTLAEMLRPQLMSLQAMTLFRPFREADASSPSGDLYKHLPMIIPLLTNISELAIARASGKRQTRPKEWPQDWLMAGIAGVYERVTGTPPKNDDASRAFFASNTIELILRRMEERWGQEVGKARLSADPGYQSIHALKFRSQTALGRRMKSGAQRWQASGGVLRFTWDN